jgi:hypothetical protein
MEPAQLAARPQGAQLVQSEGPAHLAANSEIEPPVQHRAAIR